MQRQPPSAVLSEQVVCWKFRAAEKICAQVVRSAASPTKSCFMGIELGILVWAPTAWDKDELKRNRGEIKTERLDILRVQSWDREKWTEWKWVYSVQEETEYVVCQSRYLTSLSYWNWSIHGVSYKTLKGSSSTKVWPPNWSSVSRQRC